MCVQCLEAAAEQPQRSQHRHHLQRDQHQLDRGRARRERGDEGREQYKRKESQAVLSCFLKEEVGIINTEEQGISIY